MSERVTMPALGESVTEGTVTRWLKNVGDHVEVDEPLLEVSTDKVDTEIPSPASGTLQEILAQEDETVPVGADLAVIGASTGGAAEGDDGGDDGKESSPDAAPSAQDGAAAAGGVQTQDDATPAQPSTEQPMAPETSEPEAVDPGAPEPEASKPEAPAPEASKPQTRGGTAPSGDAPSSPGGSAGGETVKMPALGESVTEGTVTRWLKAEGDSVDLDEPLLEVSTDKVDTEIPSPVAGVLTKILVGEDETVPVGGDLAVIGGQADEKGAAGTPQADQQADQQEPAQQAPAQQAPAQPAPSRGQDAAANGDSRAPEGQGDGPSYVTPLVRKLAGQHGIDLASLRGTGVGGRVRKQDVLEAAEAAKTPPAEPADATVPSSEPATPDSAASGRPAPDASLSAKRGTTEKMSRLRKIIAQRMVESLQVSAQLTTVIEVDLTKVARLRERAKRDFEAREGAKLSYLPFLALATVEALKTHPNVNASVEGDEIVFHAQENLSVAVDTDKGLIVPVVKNAGDLNIAGLARAIAELADRTRKSRITPDDLAGGTFTITNTGSRGALFDTPIINQPQVGILGTGALVKRPVVVADADGGETIAIRSMMYLALSYDHRVVDGADAARFLATMKARLEEGRFEAALGL